MVAVARRCGAAAAWAGLALLVPAVGERLSALAAPAGGLAGRLSERLPAGAAGQFGTGALLGLAWAPCIGPTLGAAFALAASGGSRTVAAIAMAAFGLGAVCRFLWWVTACAVGGAGRSRLTGIAGVSRRVFGARWW